LTGKKTPNFLKKAAPLGCVGHVYRVSVSISGINMKNWCQK